MKRIVWLIAVVFVAALGAGCGGSGPAVEQATTTFDAPKDKGKPMTMGGPTK